MTRRTCTNNRLFNSLNFLFQFKCRLKNLTLLVVIRKRHFLPDKDFQTFFSIKPKMAPQKLIIYFALS